MGYLLRINDAIKVTLFDVITLTLPKSQGPEASEALFKKSKKPKSKKTYVKTKATSTPKPTKGSEQSHSGTRKSQHLLESTTIDPKDLVGSKQPIDMGLPFTISNEGMAKTTPRPEGSLGDKDSGGNKPPADMEPINPTVADPSGTSAKYQVDQTQSTRLRYQSLTKNEGKPSHEGELDTQPLVLSTYADVRAFLLSDDEAQ
nr:hypothetical protein [Tanacetum cinerariifolium]